MCQTLATAEKWEVFSLAGSSYIGCMNFIEIIAATIFIIIVIIMGAYFNKFRNHRNWVVLLFFFMGNIAFGQQLKFDTLCLTTGDIVVAIVNSSNANVLQVTTTSGEQIQISTKDILPCSDETKGNLQKGFLKASTPKNYTLPTTKFGKPASTHLINAGTCLAFSLVGCALGGTLLGLSDKAKNEQTMRYAGVAVFCVSATFNIGTAIELSNAGKKLRRKGF